MSNLSDIVHSRVLPDGQSGQLISFSRDSVQWDWMSMVARRLNPGEVFSATTNGEEAAFVILGGRCLADWGRGPTVIGNRANVFDGLPYCVYLPTGNAVTFKAETICEIAECRVPSHKKLEPLLIAPKDVASASVAVEMLLAKLSRSFARTLRLTNWWSLRCTLLEETGLVTHRTNTTYMLLQLRLISMKSIITGSITPKKGSRCRDCILQINLAMSPFAP